MVQVGFAQAAETDSRPDLVIVLAEGEYRTEKTLPKFADRYLTNDFEVSYVRSRPEKGRHDLQGIAALKEADIALFSIRRRAPTERQMAVIREYFRSGKPLVGIRTTSHALSLRGEPPPKGHATWERFDPEVIGGNYDGHHGGGPVTTVTRVSDAMDHPILDHVETPFESIASLYKSSPLTEGTETLLTGKIEGEPAEPVAWTHTHIGGGRVFYTSLGHPEDFESRAFRQLLLNGLYWAGDRPQPGPISDKEARYWRTRITRMEVNDDLRLETLLEDPTIRQPVSLYFDARGRLWVVEYRQYPDPAGLKMLSRDEYWRVVYDKELPPPPYDADSPFRGKDRITIHEDTDGDGLFDQHKTFLDGLNITTAVTRGRGGVWVLSPPQLLFYPDEDRDDVPDGPPEVRLTGFHLQDTHSVVNSLQWGPDGWLYACQGSTVSADVKIPGRDMEPIQSMGQLIWRYHPETERYEIFAEGGGNAFGLEIDAKGRIYSGHNGGDTRGFHYVQGGYYRKGFSKHGELSNPYTFGYFPSMEHGDVRRFTHDFLIYEAKTLPRRYWGKLFGVEPLQGTVVISEITPRGSTFETRDLGHPVRDRDDRFRPVDIELGPDGAIYIADWRDRQVNHYRNHQGEIDKTDGRVYRLTQQSPEPSVPPDLTKRSTQELVDLLSHQNRWIRRTALRLIGDRQPSSFGPQFRTMIEENPGQIALEGLWALNLVDRFDEQIARKTLGHGNPYVRLWTVRLLGDDKEVSSQIARQLATIASSEPHPEVRSQLACTAKRLPAADGLPIIRSLLRRSEDTEDPHLPLLLWWAIEDKCLSNRESVLAMFKDDSLWHTAIVREHILSRLMRRYAAEESRKGFLTCARLLEMAPNQGDRQPLISGFEKAFEGRKAPAGLPERLVQALTDAGKSSLMFRVRQGNPKAAKQALKLLSQSETSIDRRIGIARAFGEIDFPKAVGPLLNVLESTTSNALIEAILAALQRYDKATIAGSVISLYPEFSSLAKTAAETLLSSRLKWSERLVDAIRANTISAEQISSETVAKLRLHESRALIRRINQIWSDTGNRKGQEDRVETRIDRLKATITSGEGDPYQGKEYFLNRCGNCHTLFTVGGDIGPDLTRYQRDDLDTLLLSIVRPSAEIRNGYQTYVVRTKDGRTLTGFLSDQDDSVIALRGIDGQDITIERSAIKTMEPRGRSLMPQGLLQSMSDQALRDLFAFLRSAQPLNE